MNKAAFTQQDLVHLLRTNAQHWCELPNVTSVGVAYRLRGGRRTSALSIQVTVSEKLTPTALRKSNIEPLPRSIRSDDGRRVPVDIVQRSYRLSYVVIPE